VPPPDDFYAPLSQSVGWTALGIALVVAVLVWWVVLWWRTRPARAPRAERHEPLRGAALEHVRRAYVARIDGVVAEHAAGRVSTRDAFQQLSPLVRRFAFEASGFPAHTKSLDELRREHPGPLVETVATMYPAEFAERVGGNVPAGGGHARRFVEAWRRPGGEVLP